MTSDNFIQEVLKQLGVQQDLVASRVGMLTDAGWDAEPTEEALEQLVGTEHFAANSHQLDWTPREIVGHLRDSNRAYKDAIVLLRSDDEPELPALEDVEEEQLQDYREAGTDDLTSQLDQSQNDLRSTIKDIQVKELDNVAIDTDGVKITLRELLESLPDHVEGHARHLSAITAEAL